MNKEKIVEISPEIRWFGVPWHEICVRDWETCLPRTPCAHCEENFVELDSGLVLEDGVPIHLECYARVVHGSQGHQRRLCNCFRELGQEDPAGMSTRQAASAAFEEFHRRVT